MYCNLASVVDANGMLLLEKLLLFKYKYLHRYGFSGKNTRERQQKVVITGGFESDGTTAR
jgi:hypothetical protein